MKTMEQRAKEARAYRKIVACIDSSKTCDQLDSCEKMINNFDNLFPTDSKREYPWMSSVKALTQYLHNKIRLHETPSSCRQIEA